MGTDMEYADSEQYKANVLLTQAQAVRQLRDAGYSPESVIDAVYNGDLGLLYPGSKSSD